jgi:16S rRNA (uracil1498-N3)-methyltransferase
VSYLFAPLKHARLDYMVQKAVEMGAARLTPVLTRRTQVHRLNLERMQANAIEAAEQCGILSLPAIDEPRPLESVLRDWPQDRLLVFCDEDAPVRDPVAALQAHMPLTSCAVIIGPEGGFDPAEREQLMRVSPSVCLSLGPRILRADTAAVAALALVQAILGDGCGASST